MRTGKNLLPLLAIAMMVALPSYTSAAQVNVTTTTTVDTVQPADTIRPGEVITTTNAFDRPDLLDSRQLRAGNAGNPGSHRLFEPA